MGVDLYYVYARGNDYYAMPWTDSSLHAQSKLSVFAGATADVWWGVNSL